MTKIKMKFLTQRLFMFVVIYRRSIMSIVPGLQLIHNFITPTQETELLNFINEQNWSLTLSRRTQQYGYEYDYSVKSAKMLKKTTPIGQIFKDLMQNIYPIDDTSQIIINEYKPGQGIYSHTDSKIFGKTIMSVSLGSSIGMIFKNATENKSYNIYVPQRSLLIMEEDARYIWTHGIERVKHDKNLVDANSGKLINNMMKQSLQRTTRVSITIRKLSQ